MLSEWAKVRGIGKSLKYHSLNSSLISLNFFTIQEKMEFPAESSTEDLIGIGLGLGFGGSTNIYLKKGTFIV